MRLSTEDAMVDPFALQDYTREEEENMILEISRMIFEAEQAGLEKDRKIAALEYQIEMMQDEVSLGDLEKELEIIKAQIQELSSSIASVPVSRVEVLETIVSHQGTQLYSFQQENEDLRTELTEVRELFLMKSRSSGTHTTASNSSFSTDTAGNLSHAGNSMSLYGSDESPRFIDPILESHTVGHSMCSIAESTRSLALHSENFHNQGRLSDMSVRQPSSSRRGPKVPKRSATDVVKKMNTLFI